MLRLLCRSLGASRIKPSKPHTLSTKTVFGKRWSSSTLENSLDGISNKGQVQDKASRAIGYWLLGISGLTFSMVSLGGLTRLTESGLSIVEWNLVTGILPPISAKDWEAEFEKYQKSPEYEKLNKGMVLSDFKKIFYMEWAHRIGGRFVGLAFILPGLYFAKKGYFHTKNMKLRVLGIGSLIGFQGVLGWYMVKSGLSDKLKEPGQVPRVSQYRLAAHLGTAFLVYWLSINTAWKAFWEAKMSSFVLDEKLLQLIKDPRWRKFRFGATTITHMAFITALSGAFVAGLDAGMIYDTFPLMGGRWIPSDFWSPYITPAWKNLLENPTAVQFNHRVLGETTWIMTLLFWLLARRMPKSPLTPWVHGCMAMATLQAGLGITALLYQVPIPIAAAHQAGALGLITVGGRLVHLIKRLPKAK